MRHYLSFFRFLQDIQHRYFGVHHDCDYNRLYADVLDKRIDILPLSHQQLRDGYVDHIRQRYPDDLIKSYNLPQEKAFDSNRLPINMWADEWVTIHYAVHMNSSMGSITPIAIYFRVEDKR